MLIRASGEVFPGFYLLSLGNSTHYLIAGDADCTLFDPGLSVHIGPLLERIRQFSPRSAVIKDVFLTHLHAERVGGLPVLRKLCPQIKVWGSPAMKERLSDERLIRSIFEEDRQLSALYPEAPSFVPLPWDEYRNQLVIDRVFPESQTFACPPDLSWRAVFSAGHTPESVFYFIEPFHLLIADEGVGYFRGKHLAAPGADADLGESLQTLQRLKNMELEAICFPNTGLITGELVGRHLEAVIQNTQDLTSQAEKSIKSGTDPGVVREVIYSSFYATASHDPLIRHVLDRSFESLWCQLT